ncbi:hypothetical protein Kpol_460p7 [Vanderwaltozyma polyspora DSM 70294]|uniref:SIT4-associating protein SAP155 n=1 Tax=Vanderwaltozyma polyspora (strain ATCC 22028 / DSM 70294 / BCRC 21397 / CBS 2163 / NBRC 10782 / NRRL Y-8283 / UCD 57-17) TaxID=436907 RepID=A7TQS3_VANPO|nr:uncharacterized protein Kpol_460p7 [Vanderwaltozyma polyspora DSM 70294]EDO15372.1 hypothetical protein Kpol_460p7 [Vanderwaltozyma polyspora DSM 70294]
MSFWPFGQNLSHSNINKILEEYIQVLHRDDNDNKHNEENVRIDEINKKTSDFAEDNIDPIDSNPVNDTYRDSVPIKKSNAINSNEDNVQNKEDTLIPQHLAERKLDSYFIDTILDDPELLNELMRQNSSLLDFICLGYFYDYNCDNDNNSISYNDIDVSNESNEIKSNNSNDNDYDEHISNKKKPKFLKMIHNLEYLIDILMDSIDKIILDDETNESEIDISNETVIGNDSLNEDLKEDNDKDNYDNSSLNNVPGQLNDENNDDFHLNRANVISDIFSLDIWIITESLVKNQKYLNKIWAVLKNKNFKYEKSPLIPIFLKINQNLLLTRQDQYLNFIRSLPTFVDDMLEHITITVMMDFFLKCISTDNLEAPTGIIEVVRDQALISKTLAFFDNENYSADFQACTCDFLKALIAISANAPLDDMSIGPNSLTRELASQESIMKFVEIIVSQRGSALNNIVSIVIELIRKNNSDYDTINLLNTTIQDFPPSNRDPIYLGYLLRQFSLNLKDILEIIVDSDDQSTYLNQLGQSFKPLGFEKFKIVELIAELLHCSNMALMNSKKVEKIARSRDHFRHQLTNQLQDALQDLTISSSVETNNDNLGDSVNKIKSISSDDEMNSESSNQMESEEELDESFEIPYVNENQNLKLRNNPTVGDLFKISLHDTQILPIIIDLFLSHPWNNFWHNVIFDIIQQIFNGRMDFSYNSFLVYSLFDSVGARNFMDLENGKNPSLTDKPMKITNDFILRGYKDSYDFYEENRMSLGYMGHLVLIAEEVVKFSKLYKIELISPGIYDTIQEDAWKFYSDEILHSTRIMYSKILGGGNYVDDGNGNIIPQLPDPQPQDIDGDMETSSVSCSEEGFDENGEDGKLINSESADEPLRFFTELDLHDKLKSLWNHINGDTNTLNDERIPESIEDDSTDKAEISDDNIAPMAVSCDSG